jgi:DNA segregation ATPase FtsK/SpoIIIE-like protein
MGYPAMPYIVIVVDEVAELMLSSGARLKTK